jgi:hypothetical protein
MLSPEERELEQRLHGQYPDEAGFDDTAEQDHGAEIEELVFAEAPPLGGAIAGHSGGLDQGEAAMAQGLSQDAEMKQLHAKVRALKSENITLDDLHERSSAQLDDLKARLRSVLDDMVAERADLISRVARIDHRAQLLGFDLVVTPQAA